MKDYEQVVCDNVECASDIFDQKLMLFKKSRFITGAAKDEIQTVPVIICVRCGNINEEFKPKIG